MGTERLVIEITEKGALVVKKNIADIGATSKAAGSSVDFLKKSLGALGALALTRTLIGLSDTFTNLQNRIRVVTKNEDELVAVTERLFAIANETRGSFEGTTEVYARLAGSAKDLGVSQEEILQVTKSLNQAVILSGAGAQEANAALIQFSQGIASGALRGDELRSVLEQVPVIADVIADRLGVTRGELRKLGQDGKITAETIFSAFANARKELEERFGETVPTIGQAFQVLKNNVTRVFGEFTTSSGASQTFAETLLLIANNVDKVTEALNFFGDVVRAVFNQAREVSLDFWESIGSQGDEAFGFLAHAIKNTGLLVLNMLRNLAIWLDKTYGALFGIAGVIIFTFKKIPGALADIFLQAFNGMVEIAETAINKVIGGINRIRTAFGKDLIEDVQLGRATNKFEGDAKELGIVARDVFLDAWNQNDLTNFIDGVIDNVTDSVGERAAREAREKAKGLVDLTETGAPAARSTDEKEKKDRRKTFAEIVRELQREAQALQFVGREREIHNGLLGIENQLRRDLTPAEEATATALLRTNVSLSEQAALYDEIRGPQEEILRQQEALNLLYQSGAITLEEYNKKQMDLRSGLRALSNDPLIKLADTAISSIYTNGIEALGNFKSTWRDFFEGFLSDLSKLAAQQLLFTFLFQGLKLPMPKGFQHGGSFEVGGSGGPDSQTVAFRASPGEQVTVAPPGGGGAGGITIVNVIDPDEIREAMSAREGEQVILNIISRNRSTVRQAMA